MPDNKKHHYVPRFYLKRFSRDSHSIGLYNYKNGLTIEKARLKTQCYRNYLYGKDDTVEFALGVVEGVSAELFRKIDRANLLPPFGHPDHINLLLYLLIQHGRTLYAADTLNEMHDQLIKKIFKEKFEAEHPDIDLDKFTISIKNSAEYAVGIHAQNYPILIDLDSVLIVNNTACEFVTSDNPVVMINPFMQFRKHGSNCGIGAKGLLIFLPIGPDKVALLFDNGVYSIHGMKEWCVFLSNPIDVHNINTLQACATYENIYFREENFGLNALIKKSKPHRRTRKGKVSSFGKKQTDSGSEEFIMSSVEDIRFVPKLSFLGISRSAKKWRESFRKKRLQPAAVVRNQELMDIHKEFTDGVDDGKYKPGGFFDYLKERESDEG